MKVIEKDLVVTDPCYFTREDDWCTRIDPFEYKLGEGFTEYEWEDTGYGDGSLAVFSIPSTFDPDGHIEEIGVADDEDLELVRTDIGRCGVDSGSFGVFILDEVKQYNPDFPNDLPLTCYCIIPNFTGTIYSTRDSNGYTHFIMRPDDKNKPFILTD